MDNNFKTIGDVFAGKESKKTTAYQWQELALKVISELGIPDFKRGAVFSVCKNNNQQFVQTCLNDTKELCTSGQKWKYFFKLASLK